MFFKAIIKRKPTGRPQSRLRAAFSLVEVVLAIGIFLVTVLALVGLMGPTLRSVKEVEQVDDVSSVVNTVNGFLQNPEGMVSAGSSAFNLIYQVVEEGSHATMFVLQKYVSPTSSDVELRVGFSPSEIVIGASPGPLFYVLRRDQGENANTFFSEEITGTIYRVVLTPSSVIPEEFRSPERNPSTGVYTLNQSLDNYEEGFLALEVRIFAENPGSSFDPSLDLTDLVNVDPIFTYNTAIVR